MSSKLVIMAGLAVVFGGTSYFAGNKYLEGQTRARMSQIENRGSEIQLANVVVATQSMAFGETLLEENLKLVPWPKNALPEGSYASIEEILGKGERKVVQPIEANEPVLKVKLTGENGRGGLAGIISEGMRAVTIPVDLVNGVGGFVMPGDRVDIVFSQRSRDTGAQTAEILMENVKVLSIDQQANTRANTPKVAKSVTLETDAAGAQKLALATSSGKLSLLLRAAGDVKSVNKERVSFDAQAKAETAETELEDEEKEGFLSFLQSEDKTTKVKVVARDKVLDATVPVHKQLKKAKAE